jgi:uncharacterized protein
MSLDDSGRTVPEEEQGALKPGPQGPFRAPSRHNPRLQALVQAANADAGLLQLWRSANINAVDRSAISDHGEVHVRIVANAALRMLRLLVEAGVIPSVVKDHGLGSDDAELIVVLACCLHDVGIAISRRDHERHSLVLAAPKARELVAGIYQEPALTVVQCEVLHAIAAHHWDEPCLTIEAGVVKVADALDMSEGRSRIPFEAGQMNIHSISAQAIEAVSIERGSERPVRVSITMSNSAGIFQVDELLKRKLLNSSLAPYVEITAAVSGETERRLMQVYRH